MSPKHYKKCRQSQDLGKSRKKQKSSFKKKINLNYFKSALQTQVKPCLEKLNQDSDVDVKFFSNEALESNFDQLIKIECFISFKKLIF